MCLGWNFWLSKNRPSLNKWRRSLEKRDGAWCWEMIFDTTEAQEKSRPTRKGGIRTPFSWLAGAVFRLGQRIPPFSVGTPPDRHIFLIHFSLPIQLLS